MADDGYVLKPIGVVRSPLRDRADAPRQGSEGAPDAWIVLEPSVADALQGIRVGDELVLLTWLHEADRSVLQVHPRDDDTRPLTGVFATRSSDRPNPIGLHRVAVLGSWTRARCRSARGDRRHPARRHQARASLGVALHRRVEGQLGHGKSVRRTKASASWAPYARSIPESSHSMESGPSYPMRLSARKSARSPRRRGPVRRSPNPGPRRRS